MSYKLKSKHEHKYKIVKEARVKMMARRLYGLSYYPYWVCTKCGEIITAS